MPKILPEQFIESHNIAFFFHDAMLSTIHDLEKNGILSTKLEFNDKETSEEFSKIPKKDTFRFLEERDKKDELYELITKLSYHSLLSDMLHFIYESLKCSEKGKLTVAYAILRKPFKESLFYLEMLATNHIDFYERLKSEDPNELNLSNSKIFDDTTKKKIISNAIAKCPYEPIFDSEFIYDVRYNKHCEYGIELLWQRANHLITTFGPIATEPFNFNFIFLNGKDINSLWFHYYRTVPFLLFYTFNVIEAIIGKFTVFDPQKADTLPLKAFAGFAIWAENSDWDEIVEPIGSIGKNVTKDIPFLCAKCNKSFDFDIKIYKQIFYDDFVKCPNCRFKIRLL
ncbi:hypothetical protein [Leptospira alstonii]|uniref:Uncharacterized protein n=2 Tax=Leptospira alstonii TaxID=28452 RepID=M6CWD3_9LEPT|nr:hypothetical protein [Leptospira alstonii]EMJ90555.1 hypothetical protein LEP1GSC194_3867 [Leptospira alstonii serovar Sichuan str. 79601]EQA82068.1 hypothetical protein LEP1GSC193_3460 [Leptospira alstonii serovar Pingchang str. 80-412]